MQEKFYLWMHGETRMQRVELYIYLNVFWKDFHVSYIKNDKKFWYSNHKTEGCKMVNLSFWVFLCLLFLSHLFITFYPLPPDVGSLFLNYLSEFYTHITSFNPSLLSYWVNIAVLILVADMGR